MSAKKITTCSHGQGTACDWCRLEREMNAMITELYRRLQEGAGHTPLTKRKRRTGVHLTPVESTQPRNAPISLADERRKRQ